MTDPAEILERVTREAHDAADEVVYSSLFDAGRNYGPDPRTRDDDVKAAHAAIDRLARVAGLVGEIKGHRHTITTGDFSVACPTEQSCPERDRLMSELEKEANG